MIVDFRWNGTDNNNNIIKTIRWESVLFDRTKFAVIVSDSGVDDDSYQTEAETELKLKENPSTSKKG